MKTTLNRIKEHSPCSEGWSKLLTYLNKTEADDEPLDLLTILESNGVEDCLWAFKCTDNHNSIYRHIAADFAESVLHIYESDYPNDNRPRLAIQAARDYADGKIYDAASNAAKAAARAASNAAWAASWAARNASNVACDAWAASDATSNAARAASDVARDAAWAASNAAWAASDATSNAARAASDVACAARFASNAARVAAVATELEKQKKIIIKWLS